MMTCYAALPLMTKLKVLLISLLLDIFTEVVEDGAQTQDIRILAEP
jgi:hypothetical protein